MRPALKTLTVATAALVTLAIGAPAASAVVQPPAHVVIIFMENHSLSQITGDPADMPLQLVPQLRGALQRAGPEQ